MKILTEIKNHHLATPFLYPVDKKLHLDYYEKIEEPMDISTVEQKLKEGEYETGYQFAFHMRLIWSNSFFYNSNNSQLYSATMELSTFFEKIMKGNEGLILGEKKDLVNELHKKIDKLSQGFKEIQNKPKPVVNQQDNKPLTYIEKKQLCENIKKIEPKYLKGVLDIVKECTDMKGEELEFDIDKLPPKVCRELDKYTRNCLKNVIKPQNPKKSTSFEGAKPPQDGNMARLKELESQMETITNNDIYIPADSEPSSESSSTSESEEEVPSAGIHNPEGYQQRNEENSEFTTGYGSMIDFNKFY